MGLDIGLGSCSIQEKSVSVRNCFPMGGWTCAREVAQIEAGSRDLGHVAFLLTENKTRNKRGFFFLVEVRVPFVFPGRGKVMRCSARRGGLMGEEGI